MIVSSMKGLGFRNRDAKPAPRTGEHVKKLRALSLAVIAMAAVFAVMAAPASAIKWTGTGSTWSGTLKFKHKELGTSECTYSKQSLEFWLGDPSTLANTSPGWAPKENCTGGSKALWWPLLEIGEKKSATEYQINFFEDLLSEAHT